MQLEFDFSGTLVSHKCHIFVENKRKKHLKRCKIVPKIKRKWTIHNELSIYGRGIRIRTLNNGVRVRCVTVTLYLYIMICTINAFTIITYKNNLSSFILKF